MLKKCGIWVMLLALVGSGCGPFTGTLSQAPGTKGAYEALLASLNNVLDDAEVNTSYRSSSNTKCRRTFDCSANPAQAYVLYSSCATIPGVELLSGLTTSVFSSSSACTRFSQGLLPTANFTALKSYQNYLRTDAAGQMRQTSPDGVTLAYESAANSWTISYHAFNRKTEVAATNGSTRVVENLDLQSTVDFISTGLRAAASRTIAQGTMKVTDQLSSRVSHMSLGNVSWGLSSCCYPTRGAIENSVTEGSETYSEALSFSTTCGEVTYSKGETTTQFTLTRGCE